VGEEESLQEKYCTGERAKKVVQGIVRKTGRLDSVLLNCSGERPPLIQVFSVLVGGQTGNCTLRDIQPEWGEVPEGKD